MFWWYPGPSYQAIMTVLRSRYTYWLMIAAGVALSVWFVCEDSYIRDAPSRLRRVPCVVDDSDVVVHSCDHHGWPTSFAPAVTFTYTAADGPHTATGYRLREGGMPEAEAEIIADRYPPGLQTSCWYDPDNPEKAVLTLEADTRSMGTMVVFALVLGLGGLVGWVVVDFVCKPFAASAPPPLPADDGLAASLAAPLPPPARPAHAAPPDALQAVPDALPVAPAYRPRWANRGAQ
jgi:hypothetical protein